MYDDLSGCRKEGCLKCSLSVSLFCAFCGSGFLTAEHTEEDQNTEQNTEKPERQSPAFRTSFTFLQNRNALSSIR